MTFGGGNATATGVLATASTQSATIGATQASPR